MIIECPACTTRYDIKSQLPPEGRTVRCAKCGNIWRARAKPAEQPEPPPEQAAPVEAARPPHPSRHLEAAAPRFEKHEEKERTGAMEGEEDGGGGDGGDYSSTDNPYERHAPSFEAPQSFELETATASPYRREEASPFIEAAGREVEGIPEEQDEGTRNGFEADPEDQDQDRNTKVSWFSSFSKRKNGRRIERELQDDAPLGAKPPEPIPFPKLASGADKPTPGLSGDLRTLEEAREALRGVFANLEQEGHAGPSLAAAPRAAAPSVPRAGHEPPSLFSAWPPISRAPGESDQDDGPAETSAADWEEAVPAIIETAQAAPLDRWDRTVPETGEEEPVAESHPWFKSWRQKPSGDVQDAEPDPDSQLRNALRLHFSEPAASEKAEASAPSAGAPDEDVQRSIIERFAASWKRPESPAQEDTVEPESAPEEASEAEESETSFDPRLFREIEETLEKGKNPRPFDGRAGLALAAAWGLFLCVAAGLVIGLFAFRDIATGVIPGLSSLYRSVGLTADGQALVIDPLDYEWAIEEFKPVLVIKGTVTNNGARPLKVPEFVLTVKDNDPALDQEYPASLNLEKDEIAPGQRADFQIELQSPSPSITAVEVELRHIH